MTNRQIRARCLLFRIALPSNRNLDGLVVEGVDLYDDGVNYGITYRFIDQQVSFGGGWHDITDGIAARCMVPLSAAARAMRAIALAGCTQ